MAGSARDGVRSWAGLGLLLLAGCNGYDQHGAERALSAVRQKAAREALPTYGDEAGRRYREERLPEGAAEVPWERYEVARKRMRSLQRYATPAGRFVEPGATEKAALAWTELGPGNIAGRTRALVIDPVQSRTMYAAGVSGGIWKSVDGGGNWRWIADELSHLGVASLAMDPSDPKVLYAGTGEGIILGPRGDGIYRTTDGGETWQSLTFTADKIAFNYVNDIVVSSADSRRIYAATRSGVWRSLDRGTTWARVLDPETGSGCEDLVIRTDKAGDVMLAACGRAERGSVWRNVRADSPQGRWVKVLTEPALGRTSLAIAPSKQDVIYAVSSSYSGDPEVPNGPDNDYLDSLHAVFRSVDGGATWEARVRNTDAVKLNTLLLSYALIANGSACGIQPSEDDTVFGQGRYASTIAVDPVNPDRVWVGGIDLFRSDDGGRNWGLASYWWAFGDNAKHSYVHADQHGIVFHPKYNGVKNRILYVVNDGGIFQTRNALASTEKGAAAGCNPSRVGMAWKELNRGYGSIQFYYGVPRADGASYLGGTQDNGTVLGSDAEGRGGWQMVIGGDGDFVAADPRDPNVLYGYVRGGPQVLKSIDGGVSFNDASYGLDDFSGPFVIDPAKRKRLWYAGQRVWRSENAASTWLPASEIYQDFGSIASSIAVSPVDSNRVLVGTRDGSILRSAAALSATGDTEWARVHPRNGQVSWIAFDPVDPNVAYATYSNFSVAGDPHVWKTTDGGATWNPIDGTGE
ncbi:MAG TPA: hypothetical protein VIW92_02975, partial [Thermoanaerobaculia bacterium]